MLQRVKQFIAAITAKIDLQEKQLVSKFLDKDEEKIFFSMAVFDQKHAINVAKVALNLVNDKDVDLQLLVKAALLHDVGRKRGDLSVTDKVCVVIIDKLSKGKAKNWGILGKGNKLDNIRHATYVYYNHPARSGKELMRINSEHKLVELVVKHHDDERKDDSEELKILRAADDLS